MASPPSPRRLLTQKKPASGTTRPKRTGSKESCCANRRRQRPKAVSARRLPCRAASRRARGNCGRPSEGLQLLAASYEWFTEGHDVPDLQEARRVLGELMTVV